MKTLPQNLAAEPQRFCRILGERGEHVLVFEDRHFPFLFWSNSTPSSFPTFNNSSLGSVSKFCKKLP